jgi:capsular polysaccharide biosynthesis protein
VELSRFIEIIRGRLLLIVLIALGSAAAAFLVSEWLPREYESEARVVVGSLTENSIDQQRANQQNAATYAELAKTPIVLIPVADELGLTEDPTAMSARIDVRSPSGQSIVRIVARGPSPRAAQQLADGVAAQIIRLATPVGKTTSIAAIVQPAVYPDGPSSPRILLNTLIAAFAGLALGLGLALLFPVGGTAVPLPAVKLVDITVPDSSGVVDGGTTSREREAPAEGGVRRRSLGAAYLRLLLIGAFGGHRYYLGDVDGGRRYLATVLFGGGLAIEGLLVVQLWPQQASTIGLALGVVGLLLLALVIISLLLDAFRLPALVSGANATAQAAIGTETAIAVR